jgi:phosphate transport system permease protein
MSSTLPANESPMMMSGAFAGKGARRLMTTPPPKMPARPSALADQLFGWAAKGAAWLTLVLLFGILLSLVVGAWPAIDKYGLSFLTNTTWDPVKEEFGGLVMIYGTVVTSIIALLIAVPVSFGIALFLTELSPAWLKRPLGTAIELLAAVPSIVYGMWGLLVFGPILSSYVQQPLQSLFSGVPYLGALVSGPPVGIGILSAGIILAIMIIPFIASVMRDVFEVTGSGVPGGFALYQGRRRWRHHAGFGPRHR